MKGERGARAEGERSGLDIIADAHAAYPRDECLFDPVAPAVFIRC